MRTTIAVDDHLLAAARRRAKELDLTLGQFIERSLQVELTRSKPRVPPPPVPVFKGGTGTLPGVDLNSNRAVRERLDAELPLDKLRW